MRYSQDNTTLIDDDQQFRKAVMSDKKRVLIVDDDPRIREFMSRVLEMEGYDVANATDGAIALGMLEEVDPHLILLDMRMEVMDGIQFIQRYRGLAISHAPVILLTGIDDTMTAISDLDIDGFLPKPFDLDRLLDLVEQHIKTDLRSS